MTAFFTRALLLAVLLGSRYLAFGQAQAQYSTAARSDTWMDSVRRLSLPQQIAAIRARALADTIYRGLQPALCRVLIGTVNGQPAPAPIRVADQLVDTRPLGATLFYVVDGYPMINTTAGAVADFWRHVAARPIRQVTLLNGQSAAAIYGSRGANGAVILSNKKP